MKVLDDRLLASLTVHLPVHLNFRRSPLAAPKPRVSTFCQFVLQLSFLAITAQDCACQPT